MEWESTAPDTVRTEDSGALVSRVVSVRVVEGPDAGQALTIERGTAVIGSSAGADLVLRDPKVSRTHLEVACVGSGVRVRDLGSTNGTFLGPMRVEALILKTASELRLGTSKVAIAWQDVPLPPPISRRTSFGELIGPSVAMRRVFGLFERVAGAGTSLLLEGEPGTGKSAAAVAIHAASPQRSGPLRTLALHEGCPPAEIESAFGDAHGGTIVLEDVDRAGVHVAASLMAALERVERGELTVRVIATSRRDVVDAVARGEVRRDLFDHVAGIRVRMPSLRERPEDLHALVQAIAGRLSAGGPTLAPEVVDGLSPEALPGNVRDLVRLVEEALMVEHGRLGDSDARPLAPEGEPLGSLTFKEAKRRVVESFGREYVKKLLDAHGGSVGRAAEAAGLDRHHFAELARRWGVR